LKTLSGIPASSGLAVGPFFLLNNEIPVPSSQKSDQNPEIEIEILEAAVKKVGLALRARANGLEGATREILLATAEIATDSAITQEAAALIADGHTSGYAISKAMETFRDLLKASGGYMAERVTDLENIRDRVLCEISGVSYPEIPHFEVPTVLIAQDLSPADTADLDAEMILAIVIEEGGPTSHTAIIARANSIASIVACKGVVEAAKLSAGSQVSVNAVSGQITFSPEPTLIAQIAEKIEKRKVRAVGVLPHSNEGYLTRDGTSVPIYANVGQSKEGLQAISAGADGIGLLRTELLFLDRSTAPTLEEQVSTYASLFQPFAGKKVIVRTLDAGADKPMAFFDFGHQPNPALGVRGYRTSVSHRTLLTMQLQAISEAAKMTTAEVCVMAPMITLPQEAKTFLHLAREYDLKNVGVMIEVPSAIFLADEIVEICDFVSIGTNDLGQYLHAADRESASLAEFNNPWQPALLRSVHLIAQAGARKNTPVGVCGEAASDATLAAVLVGLGVSSLSANVSAIANVAHVITTHSREELLQAGKAVLASKTAQEAKDVARLALPKLIDGVN